MQESKSSPNLVHPQRNSSIRLKKKRDEVKKQFLNNRRSGDFGYSLSSTDVNSFEDDHKVDTLDPHLDSSGIQHNLRPLLKKKYRQDPLSDGEEDIGRRLGEGRRMWAGQAVGVKITDFGMIDQPTVDISLNDKR